jgi:SAM-dependent methyltransferase
MKSRFADKFNHDEDAEGYDVDVLNEDNPVRAGYDKLLDWMAAQAAPTTQCRILDLGAGTGNLGLRLPRFGELVCVDVSKGMVGIGKEKLKGRSGVIWVVSDVLQYFDQPVSAFDVVLSSYAIHHLTLGEKDHLFGRIWAHLAPGGRALFGDLMFEDRAAREGLLGEYRRSGRRELVGEIEDEFFWDLDLATQSLRNLGFDLEVQRFSELSWGVSARKPG